MTCPHCNDTGISSGAPDDIGAGVTMSPCECDAGLAWVALGGNMARRMWVKRDYDGWPGWMLEIEVVPLSAYRAQRDSLMAMLRQANDRADRAEDERDSLMARLQDANDKLDWAQTTLEVMGR